MDNLLADITLACAYIGIICLALAVLASWSDVLENKRPWVDTRISNDA